MKVFQLCLWLLACAAPAFAAPALEVFDSEFDMGMVAQNCTVAHTAWLRSTGEDTLVIESVRTGCGCLTVPLGPSAIPPGDSLALTSYWQTRDRQGQSSQTAYLFANSSADPIELTLSADIVAALDSVPEVICALGSSHFESEGPKSEALAFSLTNSSDRDLGLTVITGTNDIRVELPDTVKAGESVAGTVLRSEPLNQKEFESSFTLVLSRNLNNSFRMTIPVVSGDFSFRPTFSTTE